MLITPAELLQAWERMRTHATKVWRKEIEEIQAEHKARNPQAWCGAFAQRIAAGLHTEQILQPIAIPKNNGGQRILLVPSFEDRLIQSALAQHISDTLDGHFSANSHAYRPSKGVHTACESLREMMTLPHTGWLLDADISDCFDQIDHALVEGLLKQHGLWDQHANLLQQMLRSSIRAAPALGFAAPCSLVRGLPQGSPLSPVLCNMVLHTLDAALLAQSLNFVRYADDFVVLASSESHAFEVRQLVESVLASIGLRLNDAKTHIRPCSEGFDFLGQRFGNEASAPIATAAASQSEPIHVQQTKPEPAEAYPLEATAEVDPLLRTLYLLEPNTTLEREGHQLCVIAPGQDPLRVPAERLHQIMAFGATHFTSGAINLCLEMGIPVMLLGAHGRYFGVIDPLKIDNLNVQRAQFRVLDQPSAVLEIARCIVRGKITNQQMMLRRWHRHRPPEDAAHTLELYDSLHLAQSKASRSESIESLRGYEGAAAASYWRAIKALLLPEWKFEGRRRQPPPDPVNALLSYGYTLLYYNILTLLAARGLNPYAGFLHSPRHGHHALVSDMMEEFRSPVVDALVLDCVQNGRIKPGDFTWPENHGEGCFISASARKAFVHAFEKKLNTPVRHAHYDLKMDWRRILDGQVLHLVQVLLGKNAAYLPYIIKP